MTLEKISLWIGVIGFVAAVVWAYANLNNRLGNMETKIAGIERALGSAACNAILPRQIEAIEKGRKEAREALERLSEQYECGPSRTGDPLTWRVDDAANAVAMSAQNVSDLSADLNAVDVLLNEGNQP